MADSQNTYTQEIKDLINWEISVLEQRITDQTSMTEAYANKLAEVRQGLVDFQKQQQLVNEQDINDWKELWTKVKAQSLTIPPSLKTLLQQALSTVNGNAKILFIRTLNLWLQNSDLALSFTPPVSSEAYETLKSNQAHWADGDAIRYKRLLLELCIPELRHRPAFVLEKSAAPRYWRPNDPVVLISGIKPSPRHGNTSPQTTITNDWMQDGKMSLASWQAFEALSLDKNTTKNTSSDWHPVMMDWVLEFSPVSKQSTSEYGSDYFTAYNTPGPVDFSSTGKAPNYDTQIAYTGRSILTPHGQLSIKKALSRELTADVVQQFRQDKQVKDTVDLDTFKAWVLSFAPSVSDLPARASLRNPDDQVTAWVEKTLSENETDGPALAKGFLAKLEAGNYDLILDQFISKNPAEKDLAGNVDSWVNWCLPRLNIKAGFVKAKNLTIKEPIDIWLAESEDNRKSFANWLKNLAGDFWKKTNPKDHSRTEERIQATVAAYQAASRASFHRIINLLSYLKAADMHGLSQAFGGFNQALLQHHQTSQLEVKDPFPKESGDTFAHKVRAAILEKNIASPMLELTFSPLREGKMKIGRMVLIDNFGQSWGWGLDENIYPDVISSKSMRGGASNEAMLPARFTQPTRLNFRWLSAWHELVEMNGHPATNPVCGWFLPNNLDGSLMVYGAKGEAYGYIDEMGLWRVFPGNAGPVIPDAISNPYLARTVNWLCKKGQNKADFIQDFLNSINGAMENIEPENFAQHEALSLLMGKPLALVRASLSLELKGDFAIDMAKDQFTADYRTFGDTFKGKAPDPKLDLTPFPRPNDGSADTGLSTVMGRSTMGYEQVNVPVRIGEFRQLNDGTVCYWTEGKDGSLSDEINVPESGKPPGNLFFNLMDEQPQVINMLIDPRGKVHATCGLQPVKELHLPADQYADALKAIEIAFLTTPILTPRTGIHISLPKEPGYSWSWIMKEDTGWREVGTLGIVSLTDFEKAFKAQANTVWQTLVAKGWIVEVAESRAQVVPSDQRQEAILGDAWKALEPQIELLLESCHISAFDPGASFKGSNELREGWLKLRSAD